MSESDMTYENRPMHRKQHQDRAQGAPLHFKRLGRELAMQYLFECDLMGGIQSGDTLEYFWEQAEESGEFPTNRIFRKAREYAEEIIAGVRANQIEILELMEEFSKKWDIERMSAVDRNILRVAIYELKYRTDIPPLVSINEAIEIGKDFGAEKSGVFINGILNGIKNKLAQEQKNKGNN